MNILFHGRLQPPHSGHIKLIKYFLDRYPDAVVYISLDVRTYDTNNPFPFEYRKRQIINKLNKFLQRVKIHSHCCYDNSVNGCINAIYDKFQQVTNNRPIDLVVGGPDLDKKCGSAWREKGVNIENYKYRFYGLSATKIRERYFDWNN